MGCGERSCQNYGAGVGPCRYYSGFGTCNVDCRGYESNGRIPDTARTKGITCKDCNNRDDENGHVTSAIKEMGGTWCTIYMKLVNGEHSCEYRRERTGR